eukprot:9407322-Lingulodinium_polyedra.AAC.1
MDSWEWCLRQPLRREHRPPWYQRPAQESQAFSEDTLWFRRNTPHIEPKIFDRISERVARDPSAASVAVQ